MPKCDFAGWVTKNDVRCTDGVTIRHNAFAGDSNQSVPLVWQHNYNSPTNVLGKIILQSNDKGVYGYGIFNKSEEAEHAKELIKHGDIRSLSIGARGIKKDRLNNVTHGQIYEVSLVLSGANPGALIEYPEGLQHSDTGESDEFIFYTDQLIHTSEEIEEGEEMGEFLRHAGADDAQNPAAAPTGSEDSGQTIGDILDTLSDDQMTAVETLLNAVLDEAEGAEGDDGQNDPDDEETQQSNIFEGENNMTLKHGFDAAPQNGGVIYHSATGENFTRSDFNEILKAAAEQKVSFVDALRQSGIDDEDLKHGITNMEILFPETQTEQGIQVWNPAGLNVDEILNGIGKSPIARVKNIFADISEEDARARGYIKGNQKLDAISSIFFRETTPGTIYRRESIDRDDVLDIQDNGIDVLAYINSNLQQKLKEEIVRAALLGDGRPALIDGKPNRDKIDEGHIRPVVKDDPLFTITADTTYKTFADDLVDVMTQYQGSGNPIGLMNSVDIARLRQLKDNNGRYLFGGYAGGGVPSVDSLASALGLSKILEYRQLAKGQVIIMNLADYKIGAVKNGQVTNFDFFDIDFNLYKYLAETRLSGALQTPKSAIVMTITDADTPNTYAFDPTGLKTKPSWTIDTGSSAASGTPDSSSVSSAGSSSAGV